MATSAEVLAKAHKEYGETIGSVGGSPIEAERVPTGLFPFDLATGGGFPRGRTSLIYGAESSCKTNLALLAIAQHQKIWPDLPCCFIAIEEYDKVWAKKLGVNVDKLIVFRPDYAEQAVDLVDGMMNAVDAGLLVIDSIAAMISTKESEKSAEQGSMGGNSLLVGQMVRKVSGAQRRAEKAGLAPTAIYINQVRNKIGVLYGSPETLPGGMAQLFQSSLTVRTHGKNIEDSKINKSMPIAKKLSITLRKWKVPIVAQHCELELAMVPHKGLRVGQCDDWNTLLHWMEHYSVVSPAKGGKHTLNVEPAQIFKTYKEMREYLAANPKAERAIRQAIIEQAVIDAQGEVDETHFEV